MSLPLGVTSAYFWANNGFVGPIKHHNGWCFMIATDGIDIDCYGAFSTPNFAWSRLDQTNAPALGNSETAPPFFSIYYDGTYIHLMAVRYAIFTTAYARFNCDTQTWVAASEYGGSGYYRTVYTPTDLPTTAWGGITVRSDGDVIIVHPGENPTTMGGTYQQVVYSRIEGTSLTSGVVVANSGTKAQNYLNASVVMGSSDQCHFGYIFDNDSDFYLRALPSDNDIGSRTQRSLAGTYARVVHGINYTRSSTEQIAFQVNNSSTFYKIYFDHFTDDSSPSFTSETITSTAQMVANTATIAYDSGTDDHINYVSWIDSTSADVMLATDSGGTSWTVVNSGSAIRPSITAYNLSGNVYIRGGNYVYGFVYTDSGPIYYDEWILRSASKYNFFT